MADIVIHPALAEAARYSPTLATMIKHGGPITREWWIAYNWGADASQPDTTASLETISPASLSPL
jgi:hypothetical protein